MRVGGLDGTSLIDGRGVHLMNLDFDSLNTSIKNEIIDLQ
jgi:hypothetical protein